MIELFSKILSLISDPTVVVILLCFALTLVLIWKLFGKQYEFVKDRLEMLSKENENLRTQIETFRQENERLGKSTAMISGFVRDLQSQPEKMQQLESLLRSMLSLLSQDAARMVQVQKDGFASLEGALKNLGPNREVVQLINGILEALQASQNQSARSLDELTKHATALLGEAQK